MILCNYYGLKSHPKIKSILWHIFMLMNKIHKSISVLNQTNCAVVGAVLLLDNVL